MEAFSLLKYWRSSGVRSGKATTTIFSADSNAVARTTTETIVTAAEDRPYSSDGEDGPYFDLEFAIPDQSPEIPPETDETENEDETESESGDISAHENDEDEEEEGELKFALTSNECTDQTVAALSPSDEFVFKGKLVSIEPSEENSKLPVFLVKSATKFRVLLLNKLKKSKSINGGNLEKPEKSETDEADAKKEENHEKLTGSKFMAVTFKVEDGPLASLFTRDNSSKENGHGRAVKNNVEDNNIISDSKELVVPKYLKLVKPFYIRVSKRYVEKLKFSGHLIGGGGGSKGAPPPPREADKLGEGLSTAARSDVKAQHTRQGLQAGLEVVRKHLGKSRSASTALAAATPSNRRDDSLVQLQDGIQGAILHCKRSFNSSRDVESSSIFYRSVSDPSYEKSLVMPKDSSSSAPPNDVVFWRSKRE
ncbi:hypothetical protein OROGR_026864 [Orobanche gracilis]